MSFCLLQLCWQLCARWMTRTTTEVHQQFKLSTNTNQLLGHADNTLAEHILPSLNFALGFAGQRTRIRGNNLLCIIQNRRPWRSSLALSCHQLGAVDLPQGKSKWDELEVTRSENLWENRPKTDWVSTNRSALMLFRQWFHAGTASSQADSERDRRWWYKVFQQFFFAKKKWNLVCKSTIFHDGEEKCGGWAQTRFHPPRETERVL